MSRLYGQNGTFEQNKPSNQYDFKQNPITNKLDNFNSFNFPSPYNNPETNYGLGPQIYNSVQEINTSNKNTLMQSPILRSPTKNNPMMNVMPLDYGTSQIFSDYEKTIYPGTKSMEVKNQINNEFNKGLYQDADSLFWNRLNSQREFISMPVGSVPNNQNEFAQWLYGQKGVCKQGSVFSKYGVKYTEDSLLCNGWNTPVLTNSGLLDGNLSSSVEGGDSF